MFCNFVQKVLAKNKGLKYEPDEFPDNANIEYQLGLYVGYLHSIAFNDYGIFPTPNHE
jgi:hypothetical protein